MKGTTKYTIAIRRHLPIKIIESQGVVIENMSNSMKSFDLPSRVTIKGVRGFGQLMTAMLSLHI